MALQAGRDILLKVSDGAQNPSFTTIGGLKARTIALASKTIDGTASDSPGSWRELLPEAGLKEASVSGSGVFKDLASDELVRLCFFNQHARDWQLIITDFGTLQGKFIVTALEYGGAFDAEATFSMTLTSAGQIGFTAL